MASKGSIRRNAYRDSAGPIYTKQKDLSSVVGKLPKLSSKTKKPSANHSGISSIADEKKPARRKRVTRQESAPRVATRDKSPARLESMSRSDFEAHILSLAKAFAEVAQGKSDISALTCRATESEVSRAICDALHDCVGGQTQGLLPESSAGEFCARVAVKMNDLLTPTGERPLASERLRSAAWAIDDCLAGFNAQIEPALLYSAQQVQAQTPAIINAIEALLDGKSAQGVLDSVLSRFAYRTPLFDLLCATVQSVTLRLDEPFGRGNRETFCFRLASQFTQFLRNGCPADAQLKAALMQAAAQVNVVLEGAGHGDSIEGIEFVTDIVATRLSPSELAIEAGLKEHIAQLKQTINMLLAGRPEQCPEISRPSALSNAVYLAARMARLDQVSALGAPLKLTKDEFLNRIANDIVKMLERAQGQELLTLQVAVRLLEPTLQAHGLEIPKDARS